MLITKKYFLTLIGMGVCSIAHAQAQDVTITLNAGLSLPSLGSGSWVEFPIPIFNDLYGNSANFDGVTVTESSQLISASGPGLAIGGQAEIQSNLGITALAFDDHDYGGGPLEIFYRTGNKTKEFVADQGPLTAFGTETLVQFKHAVSDIVVEGGTALVGVHIPVVPEMDPVSVLGVFLLIIGIINFRAIKAV
jgi:hypothetical protein